MAVDFSQLEEVFGDLAEELSGDFEKIMKSLGFNFMQKIVPKTPYKTGKARSNWQVGIEVVPINEVSISDPDSAVSRGLAEIRNFDVKKHDEYYIVNNVPYIEKLDAGSSTQAPTNFVEQTINESIHDVNIEI